MEIALIHKDVSIMEAVNCLFEELFLDRERAA